MLIHIDTNNRITHGRELFRPALNNFALNGKVPSDSKCPLPICNTSPRGVVLAAEMPECETLTVKADARELYIPEIDQPDGPGDLASRKGRELYHSELNGDTNGRGRQLYPPTFDFTNRKGRELYPPTFDFTNRRGRELYPPGLD